MKYITTSVILSCAILFSCTTAKIIKWEQQNKAHYRVWSNGSKDVAFIPMIHVGSPELYSDVKRVVDSFQNRGYIVYYEGVRTSGISDPILNDLYLRKLRKMVGFHLDSNGYLKILYQQYSNADKFLSDKINQPKASGLGIDKNDKNTDVSKKELVDAYEQNYGEIHLTKRDLRLPLKSGKNLPEPLRLPRDSVRYIILNYRNQYLAKSIMNSLDEKIVVLYGLGHLGGVFQELQRLDINWNRK